jgi:hypothetical protein
MGKYYDTHTLYIKCDCASADQIRGSFLEALSNYYKETGIKLSCLIQVNVLADREGNSFGTAFVYLTNSEVYHMLLGKNKDGSDRIEYKPDPNWRPPSPGSLVNEAGWCSVTETDYSNMSWADICDEEDEIERQREEEENRHICPQITIELEPLMILPPYKLTPEQRENKRIKIIQENEGKINFNPDLVSVPEFAYFGVDRAMVQSVDPKFMPNILKVQNVPEWITKEDLKEQFTPYATDNTTLQERTIKGRRVEETYPFVNINDGRVAFIIFDPSTHDAQFALHMKKKTTITKKTAAGVMSVVLIFGHSYCTDRDSMSTITQKPRPVQRRENSSNRNDRIRITEESHQSNRKENIKRVVANAVPQRKAAPTKSSNRFAVLNNIN